MAKEYINDRFGNEIYITDERWRHIELEHPDMVGYDKHVRETLQKKRRREQDEFHSDKYFYFKSFRDLYDLNNHIVVVVKFRWRRGKDGQEIPNNFVLTAYQNFF